MGRPKKERKELSEILGSKQVNEAKGAYPSINKDPREEAMRELLPVKKDIEVKPRVIFRGLGSIHFTKKNGQRVPIRFEIGIFTYSTDDSEVIDFLREKGYKEN